MTEVKHTPLPWIWHADKYGPIVRHDDGNGTGRRVANSWAQSGYGVGLVNQANAAFIVRACNSHYDLLAFVERFVKDMNNTEAHNCDAVTEARALIAKAGAA